MTSNRYLVAFVLLIVSNAAAARMCATKDPNFSVLRSAQSSFNELRMTSTFSQSQREPVNIPVIVHIVTGANGQGAVSRSRIDRQISVMNEAYAPLGISFTIDAVETHSKPEWFGIDIQAPGGWEKGNAMKAALGRSQQTKLNFYATELGGGILGYATFPWDIISDSQVDGVVMNTATLPGGNPPFDLGDTAVHEVGHWLGLLHTFQGGCNGPGDYVADTPSEGSPAYGTCGDNQGRDTCPAAGADAFTNFMNYSDDACMNRFSSGQIERARAMITLFRPMLGAAGGQSGGGNASGQQGGDNAPAARRECDANDFLTGADDCD